MISMGKGRQSRLKKILRGSGEVFTFGERAVKEIHRAKTRDGAEYLDSLGMTGSWLTRCIVLSGEKSGALRGDRREISPLREPTRSQERTRRKGIGSLRSK
jgi:hypothetical protein